MSQARFEIGDRVRMTQSARETFEKLPQTGVVVCTPRTAHSVMVRLDGNRSAQSWSTEFWEKDEPSGQ